ncbi:glucosylceramidase, partial [candidate division KSB1 bacterium]|nr:glucosylceramidase [candidate division KSB1 bacterium]
MDKRKSIRWLVVFFLIISFGHGCSKSVSEPEKPNEKTPKDSPVQFWLSDPGQNIKFAEQTAHIDTGKIADAGGIKVSPELLRQEMDGFGFALTGGSALHIHHMSATSRSALLTELFDCSGNNIGVSYLRISIGSSDLDEKVFSY